MSRRWFVPLVLLVPLFDFAAQARAVADPSWLVVCDYRYTDRIDPIVMPDGQDAMHRHDIFGAKVTRTSTFDRLRAANNDGCRNPKDESGYWTPSLYDRDGRRAGISRVNAYYRVPPRANPAAIKPWPKGLELIAGDANAAGVQTAPNGMRIVRWICTGDKGTLPTQDAPYDCAAGEHVKVTIFFPDCSNGAATSPDHKSHLAYSTSGKCPSTHPIQTMTLNLQIIYDTGKGQGAYLDSSLMQGRKDAYGMHADWMDGWSAAEKDHLLGECVYSGYGCGADRISDRPA